MNIIRKELLWKHWTTEQVNSNREWRKSLTLTEKSQVDEWDRIAAAEAADAHDCREYDNGNGICTVCGSIIRGTQADYDLHRDDPLDAML